MAVSTNLGLYLPTREDYISVSRDLSNNYEIIDKSAGMLEKGIAIVVDGDTAPRAISSGDYLFIKNHSSLATGGYHATANIANGAAVTSSNTAADSKGVTNAIKASIDSLNSKKTNFVDFGSLEGTTFTDFLKVVCASYYSNSEADNAVSFVATWYGNDYYTGLIRKHGNNVFCMAFIGSNLATCSYNASNQSITVKQYQSS